MDETNSMITEVKAQTIRARFDVLDSRRACLLTRNKEFAELSIPSLFPRNGLSEQSELPVPFSAATARGVTRLASRLTSTLVPLNNIPFFGIDLDDTEPVQGQDPTEEQKVLGRIERRVMRKLATTNFRSAVYAAIQNLEILGSVLMVAEDNYNYTLHRLDQFVIRRRPDGEWHEIIIRQWIDPSMLPALLVDAGFSETDDSPSYQYGQDKECALYTRVINNHKGGCDITREYKGKEVAKGTYEVCPYFPLRWTLVQGENYGRGLLEDNCGDIRAIEVMAEALLDSLAANAEYRFGVNPAGLTEIHDLQESENGAFVPAAKDDVFPIQLGNQAQVAAAQQCVTLKEATLGQVFLLNSSVQRNAERVTAAEIRVLANELEQALGGVFSDAAREMLIPIVRRCLWQMLKDGILMPKDDPAAASMMEELSKVDGVLGIKVRTGLEALNREVENEKMKGIMATAIQLPEEAQKAIIWPGMLNRWLSTEGLEPTGLVFTVEQMAQRAAAEQQNAMQAQAATQAMQTSGKITEQQAAQRE